MDINKNVELDEKELLKIVLEELLMVNQKLDKLLTTTQYKAPDTIMRKELVIPDDKFKPSKYGGNWEYAHLEDFIPETIEQLKDQSSFNGYLYEVGFKYVKRRKP